MACQNAASGAGSTNKPEVEPGSTLTRAARRAITKYGRATCTKAFAMHHIDGEGGSTVGIYLGLTTRQADAAINAGEAVFRNEWRIETECLTCSCTFDRYVRVMRDLIG